jgi:adenine-specific DNA-methyltransferase
MLEHLVNNTSKYISSKSKSDRKPQGQFFTPVKTARYMASMFSLPSKEVISILDPGAGSGILTAALVERLQSIPCCSRIEITCYETDLEILPLLKSNLDYLRQASKIELSIQVIENNYITSQSDDFSGSLMASHYPQKYDLIIGNPPYFKLSKDAAEATSMAEVCYGAPNIYFLFTAMSLFNLRDDGEMVYIIPRSWTSGAYFSRFRQYLFDNSRITDIHLFTSRSKVFSKEDVLQETMILKLRKTRSHIPFVRVSSSFDSDFIDNSSSLMVPYNIVISGEENYVFLITSQSEIDVLTKVNSLGKPLPEIGLKVKTGLTVDFRNRELLRNNSGEHIVPLFYSQHIKNGRVEFPIGKESEYISDELPGMVQLNHNYLFIKRFTAKEEKRRLQCAVYLARFYPEYKRISTQNKINFIDSIDGSTMSDELVFGLYTVLNSSLYDMYYRILNGSTQVNATEMNTIPVPIREDLEQLGRRLMDRDDISTAFCDRILEDVVYA